MKKGFSYPSGFFSCQHCKSLAQPTECSPLEGEIKNRNGNREGNSSAEKVPKFEVGDE